MVEKADSGKFNLFSWIHGHVQREMQEQESLLEGLSVSMEMDEALAYAVLLTDLAMSDGEFHQAEHGVIVSAIAKNFPDHKDDADVLIKTARHLILSFRGPQSFVDRMKQQYSAEERQTIYLLIDKVLSADGHEEAIENYLRKKFRELLN